MSRLEPILRFPEFTGEWQERRLGEIGSVAMCKRIFKNQTKPSGDVPFYTIGTFGKNPSAFIDKRLFDEYVGKYLFPKKGDILVSASGTIGRLVVYDGEPAYFQDSNIIWLQHDEGLILNTFLKYVYSRINWIVESSTMPRLYNNNFLATRVDMPDTKEQQKIATFLAAVDKRVALLERKVQQLEAYKRGVIQQLFSQQLRFTRPDGSHFPVWQEKRLGEVFDAARGSSLSWGDIEADGKNKAILYGQLYTIYPEVVSQVVSRTNSNKGTPSKKGDLLLPNSTTTTGIDLANATALNEDGVLLGGDITILRFKETGSNIFYAYYLSHFMKYKLAAYGQGSTIVHMYFSQYKNMKIVEPSVAEQQKIAEVLSALDEKIALTRQQLEKTKQFKKGLLQRMFV